MLENTDQKNSEYGHFLRSDFCLVLVEMVKSDPFKIWINHFQNSLLVAFKKRLLKVCGKYFKFILEAKVNI